MTVSHTNSGGTIYYTVESESLEAVEAEIAAIERNFHPVGYGTHFHEPKQQADGKWVAHGYRSTSCD